MLSKCLILTVSADYAFVLIWLAICSLYTTILTVIALSVVWILRKRRSSILKSQRPARTPFSELEFNVATPTDSAKSRRVSFSRRTGVAEFVTNEATTTWKNVYEEHNKSLESSSNDSEANASRQPVGHLGKRIFDQQFEEVEAVDFISGLPNGSLNVNFSQQLASLECTGEGKLTAPHSKFDLSAFTEQSENDEDISVSDTVNSPVQNVSKSASIDKKVSVNNDWVADKENIAINPYDAPCESNFAVNEKPDQVLVFDGKRLTLQLDIAEKDKNYKHTLLPDPPAETPQRKTIVCGTVCALYGWERVQFDDNKENNKAEEISTTQSLLNNITVNDNDASRRRTIVYENDTGNISITQAIPAQLIPGYSEDKNITFDAFNTSKNPSNRKLIAIVSDNDKGDKSMTEAIPANIIEEATNERNSLIYDKDEADIATPLALSTNVFLLDKLDSAEDCVKKPEDIKENKEKVIDYKVYEEDAHNPTGDGLQDDQKSIVFNADDLNSDVSMSKTILKVLSLQETEKRNTVIFDNDNCDISMTRPIPAELITVGTELLHKSKNIILDATEPDQGPNLQSYVIVLQASTTNSKPSLHSNTAEHGDLKNTMDIYRNVTSDSKNASLVNVVEDSIPSSVEDASANASLLHPRLKQKLNQLNLSSSSETNVDKVSEVEDLYKLFAQKRYKALGKDNALIQTKGEERKKSLPSLLTTSATSVDSGTEDKNFMCRIESKPSSDIVQQDTDVNTSNERMICISKDSDYDTQTDRETDKEGEKAQPKALTYSHSPTRQLEYKEEKPVRIDDRQIQLEELQSAVTKKNQFPNRFIEYVVNTDLDDVVEKDENVTYGKEGHNCKKANDTQELLDMTTNFTDNRDSDDDVDPAAVKIRSHTEVREPNRLSFAPNRQSIALSREDLLNNISMAQAGLQKSRLALDDSDCTVEDTRDASVDIAKKSNRTSSEVVKTLQFDDESNSDSLKFDTKYFPLKKTAFDETSYMNETKAIVIPTYLKEVSVGIKELMLDLVKPMNDNLPFESVFIDKGLTKIPSTQSMQIQANLSSQVEDCELFCNTDTSKDTDKVSSLTVAINKSRSRSLQNLLKFFAISSEMLPEFDIPKPKQRYSYSLSHSHTPVEPPPDVLVFDHLHPLNNILLAAFNYFGMHRYNAEKYDDTLCDHSRSTASHLNKSSRDNDFEVETVTTAEYRLAIRTPEKEEDVYVYTNQNDQFSIQSTSSSRPIPIDQSIDAFSTQLQDDQVNTMSAMKGNKDVLEASSSLTLVNDALDGEDRLSPDNENETRRIKFSRSNIFDIEEQATEIDVVKSPDSALSEQIDNPNTVANRTKGKKRIYNPSTDKYKQYQPAVEVTPKSITKIQKISNSPNPNKVTIVGRARSKDGIKELMLDLVKPMNDNLPFESVAIDKGQTKILSMQSTHIQADLVISSQVDLDCGLFCNADTNTDTDKGCSLTAVINKSRSRSLRSPVKFSGISSEMSSEFDIPEPMQRYSYSPPRSHSPDEPPPDVLVFDNLNPLNNILLAPLNYSGVHRYNPKKSDNTCDRSRSTGSHLNKSSRDHDLDVEPVTTEQYRLAIRNREKQEDIYVYKKQDDQFSIQSTSSSRPTSNDQSIDAFSTQLRDHQVNTVIAMKENKDLLEAISSLPLVDDALNGVGRVSPDNKNENRNIKFSRSILVDIEEQATEIDVAKSPDSALSERIDNPNTVANRTKSMKRVYSPSMDKYKQYQPAVEVTPKPITKMQEISNSPNPNKEIIVDKVRSKDISTDESTHNMAPEKDVSEHSERCSEQNAHTSNVGEKKSPKVKETKQVPTITVQQIILDYLNLDSDFKHIISEKKFLKDLNLNPKSESFTAFSQSGMSFTSSNNLNAMKDANSSSKTDCPSPRRSSATMQGMPSQMDWHPDLMFATNSNVYSSDSSVNVVAKINMLPFMGSHECKWESSSADTWSFRLLHGRLRLTARLAHRHANGTRTRVRGDTPVLDVAVETVQHDRKNPVATMTVRFASETMRYIVARLLRATCTASDMPALLRHCAAVARLALRWGRAMHDAKLHLAYNLDNEGNLSLKVANFPLRSVWEVTMRIELVVDNSQGEPGPRAGGVHVAGVVSDVFVSDADVARALAHTPRDWGHAPRTVWKIFSYLKHKTRTDETKRSY